LDLAGALDVLNSGGVVALPTDTVYGIGASLAHPSAVRALFSLKRRPSDVAMPVLVASVGQIEVLGVEWSEPARRLSDAFWPGPLTIIVAAPQELADLVGASATSAGFRLPDDVVLRALLAESGPLVVTSANEHGKAPCSNVERVRDVFAGRRELDGVLDDGERSGVVSTVVDLSGPAWRLVRAGVIGPDALAAVLD
jgi:tRNA threonylcarbamoyl adenosine modification protein (Sua5/YciO/YrdC/YwlC family)